MSQDLYFRRKFLAGTGTVAATALAGCNSSEDSASKPEKPGPEPEYNLSAEMPEEVDFNENSSLGLELYVERTLDGETEVLNPENLEINGYTVREHSGYGEGLLEQAGLYKQIDELNHLEGNIWEASKDDILAGKTSLNFEVDVKDQEYGVTDSLKTEETLNVQKTPEEILEDTWVEDSETYEQLRDQHTTEELEHGVGGQYEDWSELGEAAMHTAHEKWDIENLGTQEKLQRHAMEWIDKAKEATGINPSGQANFLAYTLETHLDNVTAGQMNNTRHNTVLLHDHQQDKTYHVETGRMGSTAHPPSEAGYPEANKNLTPLWTTNNNIPQAGSTLVEMTQVNSNRWEKETLDEQYLTDSMTQLRNGNGSEAIDTMQNLAQTRELNPSMDYRVEGTPANPEITVQ